MSAALGVHPSTLRRWMAAGHVSERTELAIRQLKYRHDKEDEWNHASLRAWLEDGVT